MKPLVSAIMPVKPGHEHFIPQALECFYQQTYERRELVILYAGHAAAKAMQVIYPRPTMGFQIQSWNCLPETLSTPGRARNAACDKARGEIIVHWDVDDWSAPNRIETQVHVLGTDSKLSVVGMRSMMFVDEQKATVWQWRGPWNSNLGTSLCYWREWWIDNPFVEKRPYGEDGSFIGAAVAASCYRVMENYGLIVARSHTLNTSIRNYEAAESWRRGSPADLPAGFLAISRFESLKAI